MRRFAILLLALPIAVFAQDTTQSAPEPAQNSYARNTLTSLAGQFFSGDFVNLYGSAAGIAGFYQVPVSNGQSVTDTSGGYLLSGGVQAYHRFRESELSLSYNLGYSDYQSASFSSGFTQNLSLLYTKRLSSRWNIAFIESAGLFRYGVSYYPQPSAATPAIANPFSPVTKFLSSGVSLTYQQTARLSYIVSGDLYLTRYDFPGSIGTTGASASGSIRYRLTERTTIGGTYSHSDYTYQHDAGDAIIDGGYFNLTHEFSQLWSANFDAGLARTDSSGFIQTPTTVIINGQQIPAEIVGPYHQDKLTPSFQGSISRHLRHLVTTASAGQGISPGNGIYLAARNRYISGAVSYTINERSIISGTLGYYNLSSLTHNISSSYANTSFGVSYAYTLARHLSAYARYDFFRYGSLSTYSGTGDNRFTFGVTFSSKGIPLTMY